MMKPPLLRSGDLITIVAPGRKTSREDAELARRTFESWGLRVELTENLFADKHSYLGGNDDQRIRDLQNALDSKTVRCIVCARGGYGTTRIVDRLDFSIFKNDPKWIVGFSDITALHLKLSSIGFESIHGTMPVQFKKDDSKDSIESLRRVLFYGNEIISAEQSSFNRFGKSTGQLTGGNLSLIVDSLGTTSEIDTINKILVIEEIDEYRYKIDRMMTQLNRAGKLEYLAGLIVGHLTDIHDTEVSFGETAEEIINYAVRNYNYPVAFGFPSGHENPNLSWIHGSDATLEVGIHSAVLSPC